MENFWRRTCLLILIGLTTITFATDLAAQDNKRVVRIARLKIDPAQLEEYTAALKEEIETSLRVEPGVLSLQAVADKHNPADITIFEIYSDEDAYRKHLEMPHFKKYKSATSGMVKSLELVDTTPIILGSKNKYN